MTLTQVNAIPVLSATQQAQLERLLKHPVCAWLQSALTAEGFMLVGGLLRDALHPRQISNPTEWTDWDIVAPPGQAQALAEQLAQRAESRYLVLDEDFGIYRVLLPSQTLDLGDGMITIDIAEQVGDSFTADLARRDMTINAMGLVFTAQGLQWLDPHGGLQDLMQGCIRMISPDNLLDDPLRFLRLFRFMATSDCPHIAPDTLAFAYQEGYKVIKSAPERIHTEWMRLLSAPRCFPAVLAVANSGMLEHIYPEFSPLKQVPANGYHHLPLWDHTLELVKQVEAQWDTLPDSLQQALLEPHNPQVSRLALCRLSCLCHDLGKPITMTYDAELDRYRFITHEVVGEDITWGLAQRSKWSRQLTTIVTQLVRWHLYPSQLIGPNVTDKTRRRFYQKHAAIMPELLVLALADRFSTQGAQINQKEDIAQHRQALFDLWEGFLAFQNTEATLPLLLNGNDVMTLLNIPPGPAIGQLLAQLREAQHNNEVTTVDEAKAWLKTHA